MGDPLSPSNMVAPEPTYDVEFAPHSLAKTMDELEASVPSKADSIKEGPVKQFHGWRKLPPEIIVPAEVVKKAEECEK